MTANPQAQSLHPLRVLLVALAIVVGSLLILRGWSGAVDTPRTPSYVIDRTQAEPPAQANYVHRSAEASDDGQLTTFERCKAQGLRTWEDLTPDGKDHAGYHCAP